MPKVQETLEPVVSETESVIQESWQRIRQALEADSNKMKEAAVARAKEESEKAVAQARQEASTESARILARAKEEADQITRKSREEAEEVRQESARVISETRQKAAQIMTEIIERGATQARDEFTLAAAEARNKTSRLLTQVSKSIEQIISETETNMTAEMERLAALFAEAETKLRPLGELINKEKETNSPRTTPEAVKPTASFNKKTEPAASVFGDKRGSTGKVSDDSRLFEGRLKLEMVPPFDQERLGGVPGWLSRVDGLRVISSGGYAGPNRWITTFNVELEQPMPLLEIFGAIPSVKDVVEHRGNIVLTLR